MADRAHPTHKTGDELTIADKSFASRLFLGSSKYPSFKVMVNAIEASETELVTVAVRYMNLDDPNQEGVLEHLRRMRCHL